MRKKVFSLTIILMILLSMSSFGTDVDADVNKVSTQFNTHEEYIQDNKSDSNLPKDSNEKVIEANSYINNAEKIVENKTTNRGKVQYTITEAPGPIEEKTNKRSIDSNKPMIAITYDDGPSKYTPEILNILKENNSAATFFVVGSNVNKNKDVLNRMIEEGNQIGNHSYNHKNLTTISDEELYKQIKGTDDLIYIATGYTPSVMRPPYGTTNEETNKKILKPIINWSIDTRDWENRNVDMITKSILENVKDGDIILMHDLYESTVQASDIVIPELINRGFQLVTIDELFEYREVSFTTGKIYYNMYK